MAKEPKTPEEAMAMGWSESEKPSTPDEAAASGWAEVSAESQVEPTKQGSASDDDYGWLGRKSKSGTALRSALEGLTGGFSGEIAGVSAALDPYAALRGVPTPATAEPYSKEAIIERYRTAKSQADLARKTGETANPKVAGVSEFVGAMALPIPGSGIVKGGSLVTKAASYGLGAGLAGFIFGSGKSEADLTKGEAPQLAMDALKSAGVAGAAGAVLGPMAQSGSKYLGEALTRKAEDKVLNAINQPGILDRFAKMGITTDAERREFARTALEGGLIKFGDDAAAIANRADEFTSHWGETIGGVVALADKSGTKADFRKAALAVMDSMKGRTEVEMLASQPTQALGEALWTQGERAAEGGPSTFEMLRRSKSAAQGAVNWAEQAPLGKELYREGAGALRNEFLSQIQPAISPEEYRRLIEANRQFGVASDVATLATNRASREAGKSPVGLSAMGAGALASQAAGGGPIGSAAAFGAANVIGSAARRYPASAAAASELGSKLTPASTRGVGRASVYEAAKSTPKPSGNKKADDEEAIDAWLSQ